MKTKARAALTTLFAMVAASGLAGCGDKCDSGDLDCFLDHMVIARPEADSQPIELRAIAGSAIKKTGGGAAPVCSVGATICNGMCIDLASDGNNCGSCGIVCNAPTQCVSGSCQCAA